MLKAALRLKDALVLRCSGMSLQHGHDEKGEWLKITYYDEDGADVRGAAKTKGHNYAGVRPEAEPAAIMQAAAALGTLISHELMGVVVTEKAELAQ